MRKTYPLFLVGLLMLSCRKDQDARPLAGIQAAFGQEFELGYNQSVLLPATTQQPALQLTLISLSDRRCPENVNCAIYNPSPAAMRVQLFSGYDEEKQVANAERDSLVVPNATGPRYVIYFKGLRPGPGKGGSPTPLQKLSIILQVFKRE